MPAASMVKSGQPAMKPFWEITPAEARACLEATNWPPAVYEYFRGGGFSSCFGTRANMPATMFRLNLVKGLGPGTTDRGRADGGPATGDL